MCRGEDNRDQATVVARSAAERSLDQSNHDVQQRYTKLGQAQIYLTFGYDLNSL